jgi:DNA end-binding protein Ku
MAARAISSGTISFGLVSIPIKLYTAASSGGIAFNFLHNRCGSRMKQQQFCPVCEEVVQRSDLVRGYEFAKNQYVRFENDELKTLEEETSKVIELEEFVPLEKVDPVYFEKTYYLGPDKGGDKAYRLLADAMTESNRVGLAKYVMRGKEGLVLIRAVQGGLMLHTMYYADEVRDFDDIDRGQTVKLKDGEMDLALRLIDELVSKEFHPENYHDEYRDRVLRLVEEKVEGKEVTALEPQVRQSQVVDLMEALKASLERRDGAAKAKAPRAAKSAAASAPGGEMSLEAELSFEEFQAAVGESGLEVAATELKRSYNGLTSLKKRKKLAPADVRGKVVNLRKDLEVIRSDPELFGNAPKKLKAARIPLTGRDWERY